MNRRELLSFSFLRKSLSKDSSDYSASDEDSVSNRLLTRPPGAIAEADFLKQCSGCPDCVAICPVEAIKIQDGYPTLNLKEIPCKACQDLPCIDACSRGALARENVRPLAEVTVNAQYCLHSQGIFCNACANRCPPHINAIGWIGPYGRKLPVLNQDSCIGCGLCWHACDQDFAIQMQDLNLIDH